MRHNAVTQHLSQRTMFIGQLGEPIVIAVQALLERRQHQDPPPVHARTTGVVSHLGMQLSAQKLKHLDAYRSFLVNLLQTPQQHRYVVARFRINPHFADEGAAQLGLCRFDLSHGRKNTEDLVDLENLMVNIEVLTVNI